MCGQILGDSFSTGPLRYENFTGNDILYFFTSLNSQAMQQHIWHKGVRSQKFTMRGCWYVLSPTYFPMS